MAVKKKQANVARLVVRCVQTFLVLGIGSDAADHVRSMRRQNVRHGLGRECARHMAFSSLLVQYGRLDNVVGSLLSSSLLDSAVL